MVVDASGLVLSDGHEVHAPIKIMSSWSLKVPSEQGMEMPAEHLRWHVEQ